MKLLDFLSFRRQQAAPSNGVEVFSFGDPEHVLDAQDLISKMLRSNWNGRFYNPPLSLRGLYKLQYANTHHASALQLKVNLLCDLFKPNKVLSLAEFRKFVTNALVLGNGYLEVIPSRKRGVPLKLEALPALYVRRLKDNQYALLTSDSGKQELHEFDKGKVLHWAEYDLDQELYGKPYYLAALQAILLNEAATIFRRKYYINGNHAGYIMYMNDPAHSIQDVKNLKKALKDAKGPGAFRNLFMYSPKGKKDGIQVIPVESAQALDKFLDIKNVSAADVSASHRVPPNMLAIQSTNAGGFGNILEAREALIKNEIIPYARLLADLSPYLDFNFPETNNNKGIV